MKNEVEILKEAEEFINGLTRKDHGKFIAVTGQIEELGIESVSTRQIDGKLRELKIKDFRISYFLIEIP